MEQLPLRTGVCKLLICTIEYTHTNKKYAHTHVHTHTHTESELKTHYVIDNAHSEFNT